VGETWTIDLVPGKFFDSKKGNNLLKKYLKHRVVKGVGPWSHEIRGLASGASACYLILKAKRVKRKTIAGLFS
jgi:hypothetical protein